MSRVDLEKLTKVYPGRVRAVDGIDLTIADQEFVVLVGPSGCGKTTTLRMIAGLEEITSGVIRIGQRVVNDVAPKDRDIAMVFQNYALYPHMSVYKNMAFGLRMRGMPRDMIRQRVSEAARILDIEHLLDRKPKALSGGQRQRVAVGRAIVREPAAFLFDEPLSNLDAKLRVTTRAEIKRLHQRLRTTTIYVTHDQEEAMTLGDRIVVMKDGVIQQADTPLRVYNAPANRFVAGFIGMPPMNFFDGAIKRMDGQTVFEEGRVEGAQNGESGPRGRGKAGSGKASNSPAELTLPGNGFTLPIPPRLRDRMEALVGTRIVLGIRPEHLDLRPAQGSGVDATESAGASAQMSAPLSVKVNVIEPLGNNMDVYVSTNLHDHVVARVEAQSSLRIDTQVALYADLRQVHFFAPGETGMNLSHASEPAHAIN